MFLKILYVRQATMEGGDKFFMQGGALGVLRTSPHTKLE